MKKPDDRSIFTIVLLAGFCSLLIEIAGSRMIAPYLGNTVYTWAAVILLIFGASSLGYYYGGRQAERSVSGPTFSMVLLKACITTLLIPLFSFPILGFARFLPHIIATIISAIPLTFATFFLCMLVPFAIKATSSSKRIGKGSGWIFALSTVGSIAGALATGFFLVTHLFIYQVFVLAAAVLLLLSWYAEKARVFEILPFAFLVFLTAYLGQVPVGNGTIIFQEPSAYQLVSVIDTEFENQQVRMLALDALIESMEYQNGSPVYEYIGNARLGYALAKNPQNALVIGVAGGTQVEDLKQHFPEIIVDGVDIDQKAVDAGKRYFSLKDDERTNIIIDDGRRALRSLDKEYDIILIDAFKGPGVPPHLVTREFFHELKQRMSGKGVLILNIVSNTNGENSRLLNFIYNTMKEEFSNVIIMPSCTDCNPSRQPIILIATENEIGRFQENHRSLIFEPNFTDSRYFTDDWNPVESYVVWG